MIPNLKTLAVTGDTPTPLIATNLVKAPNTSSNSFELNSGWSITFTADAAFHFGNDVVSRTNTDPLSAGTYQFTFRDDEVPYVLSTATGSTVNFKMAVQGLK